MYHLSDILSCFSLPPPLSFPLPLPLNAGEISYTGTGAGAGPGSDAKNSSTREHADALMVSDRDRDLYTSANIGMVNNAYYVCVGFVTSAGEAQSTQLIKVRTTWVCRTSHDHRAAYLSVQLSACQPASPPF